MAIWRPLRLMTEVDVAPFPALPAGVTLIGSVYGALGAAPAVGAVSAAEATAATTATARAARRCVARYVYMVVPPVMVVPP